MAEKKYAKDFCDAEMLVVVGSRMLRGARATGGGASADVPFFAARLAKATHNPHLMIGEGGGPAGAGGSQFTGTAYTGDYRWHLGAECCTTMEDTCDSFGNPRCRSGFEGIGLGGFQIDKYGNINMAYIGDQKRPKFRGPGTIGLMSMAFMNSNLYTRYHTPRVLVEKVDFISGPGYGDGPGWREKHGCTPGTGPQTCLTPLCIFDFDEETKIMRIKSLHPGHTVEEVKSRMGFTPIIPKDIPETEPPTVEELEIIRALDTEGRLPHLTE